MAKVVWSPRSIKDIDEIADYMANDSQQYAEEQVRQFFIKTELLVRQPLMGRVVSELAYHQSGNCFAVVTVLSMNY